MTLHKTEKHLYEKLGIKTNTNRFKRYYNAGLLNQVNEPFINDFQNYWVKHFDKQVDPILNVAYMNLTGKEEYRVVPAKVMNNVIKPFFNDGVLSDGYKDKNIYDLLIKTPHSVKMVLKCVRGRFFDSKNNSINTFDAHQILKSYSALIIKPSNSNNGVGVSKLHIHSHKMILKNKEVTFNDLKETYNFNFTMEEVIEQHPYMAEPHPQSVNTLRMVTFRWNHNIHYLLTFARFGSNGDIRDNAGMGGICVGVKDTGEFLHTAVDENAVEYTHHPTSNYCFADLKPIPNFGDFKQFVIDAHKNIIHHDFVSWDIAVDIGGKPVFIEANFSGATWLYQLAAQKPMFGELTEEVLQYVSHKIEINPLTKSKDKQLNDMEEKVKAKTKKIKELDKENDYLKADNEKRRTLNETLFNELINRDNQLQE